MPRRLFCFWDGGEGGAPARLSWPEAAALCAKKPAVRFNPERLAMFYCFSYGCISPPISNGDALVGTYDVGFAKSSRRGPTAL